MRFTSGCQGFTLYGLRSETLEMLVAPELGAKLVSLKSLKTGSEWMWRPPGTLRLFRNACGDAFENSTLVGADECLPTVASCRLKSRELPDHGEVWSIPWTVDADMWEQQQIRTTVTLPISPFRFARTISMDGNALQFNYVLTNTGNSEEAFLWAFHPLFAIEAGDRIELPEEVTEVRPTYCEGVPLIGERWRWPEPVAGVRLDRMDFGPCGDAFAKLFATCPARRAFRASIVRGRERLSMEIEPGAIPALGLWFNRGRWHGYVHMAIEPTTGPEDSLDAAARSGSQQYIVPAQGSRQWQFKLRLEHR